MRAGRRTRCASATSCTSPSSSPRSRRPRGCSRPGAELQLQRRARAVRSRGSGPGGEPRLPATLTPTPPADLKSEGLLADQPIDGRPNKALGYDRASCPGFALPPPALTDLRLLHGSCRRPGYIYPDDDDGTRASTGSRGWTTSSWNGVAAPRRRSALDPNVRPHQLFFTGDQIYADDVSRRCSHAEPDGQRADRQGRAPADALPAQGGRGEPGGVRQRAEAAGLRDVAGSSSRSAARQKKDPLEELKKDRRVRVLQDPCFDRALPARLRRRRGTRSTRVLDRRHG